MKRLRYTDHFRSKMSVLARHGFVVTEAQIEATVWNPDHTEPGYGHRMIYQTTVDSEHVLRIVLEETEDELVLITVYPGRRERYATH